MWLGRVRVVHRRQAARFAPRPSWRGGADEQGDDEDRDPGHGSQYIVRHIEPIAALYCCDFFWAASRSFERSPDRMFDIA